ncbi:DUF4149 domain-containing protein [Solimicrobium silvestre]|uniref:TMEM205-like domain-containing protein n=1 Tax=Solimicrobium silvestre TaxID=2099400 RepID=A0A2S9GZL1_9BURK|nr:DUF4149 domain-containing protein [Solimicrobium silvestre]PRC93143.1 hypothetical protein S2091_2229 [Solimicrobium silvestre]
MTTAWDRAQLLITTAWVGSLWTIGYLVAPTLFKTLTDSSLAGTIAGQLFYVEACLSVVCALLLLGIALYQRKRLPKLVLGMLLCTILGYFVLHPFMAELRAAGLTNPDNKWQFGMLHAISSGFYLMQSVLGAMLVLEHLNKNVEVALR